MRTGAETKIKMKSRFPASIFGLYMLVLCLMSGVHVGLIVLMNRLGWNEVIQTIVPLLYWGLVSAGVTLFTRNKMRSTYEEPMQNLAEATAKVAGGDFSVYIPTIHTSDKLDYLDVMILDFNKMVEELGSIETLKTDFVSNVSHEMKTPIAVIKNYAELLKMEHITEEKRMEYSMAIETAAMRLSNLISNILKLNKLENQRLTLERQNFNVCNQLCECILQYEESWEEKNIELEVDIDDVAMVYADEELLEMVWNNLLSNAIKFTEPNGTIRIREICDDTYVKVTVSDTGCGMSKETLQHIFDKFYQGDTSHSKEGNGLGLSLVKRVLELMDSDVQVVSKPGEGSSFTVTLPKAKKEEDL
ncbi:MAG: HAMP domain-containing sensor histidine kinase [Lachnospiraceae bacterium]|nr:HAMP domain-containing sensor histidine kinase [Lachnospiraceae bacterium]